MGRCHCASSLPPGASLDTRSAADARAVVTVSCPDITCSFHHPTTPRRALRIIVASASDTSAVRTICGGERHRRTGTGEALRDCQSSTSAPCAAGAAGAAPGPQGRPKSAQQCARAKGMLRSGAARGLDFCSVHAAEAARRPACSIGLGAVGRSLRGPAARAWGGHRARLPAQPWRMRVKCFAFLAVGGCELVSDYVPPWKDRCTGRGRRPRPLPEGRRYALPGATRYRACSAAQAHPRRRHQ